MNFFEDDKKSRLEDEKNERLKNSLWVEKYRPLELKDFIGSESLKQKAEQFIKNNDVSHLLLHGKAGGGKTTLANILVKNINCDYLYVNASSENSVDDVRDKLTRFVSTVGFKDLKIVILDECLDENTLITVLRDGEVQNIKISDSVDTDLVKSLNVDTESIEYRPFNLLDKGMQDVIEIEFENGEKIVCTESHKWYVLDDFGNKIVVNTTEMLDKGYIMTI